MKNAIIFGFLFLCLSVVDCQTNPVSSTSSTSPFMGNWKIIFAGDITGSSTSSIDSNGNFSFSVVVTYPGGSSYTDVVSGTVDTAGNVSGYAYYGGNKSATISGKLISSSAGSGTYTALPRYVGSGTWSMTKL